MSNPSYTDEPDGPPPGDRAGSKLLKGAAAVAAVAALVFGAKAVAGGDASTSTADAASGVPGQPIGAPGGGYGAPCGRPGMRRFGTEVTGDALTRLKSAVSGRYPGTVERAMKLPDGSYVVHVIRSNGQEVHVHVSKDFKVLGADRGGPPHGGMPPHGGSTTPGSSTAPAPPGTQS